MKKQFLALALISGAFVSCTDDSYDLDNISNDFRIGVNEYLPIAHSTINLHDMLNEFKSDYIEEEEDGRLFFVFDTITRIDIKPFDLKVDKYVRSIENVDYEGAVIPKGTSFPFEIPIVIENGSDGGRIDSIHVKEATFRFAVDNSKISLVINRSENEAFGNFYNASSSDDETEIILDNCWVKFPKSGDTLKLKCALKANEDINVSGLSASVVIDETKITYHSIYGSLKQNMSQNEYTDIYLNLYDDNLDFDLKIKDPKLTISALTNSGMPIDCTVKGFVGKHKTKKSSVKDSVKATFKNGADTLNIDFKCASKEGEVVPAFREEFDKVNGSLEKIFSYLPDSMSVRSSFRINGDTTSNTNYFLLDSTYLDVNINARIPLHIGQRSYLTIKDTIDGVDILKDIEDYQKSDFGVEKAEVILDIENKLPLEAVVDVKFCSVDTVKGTPIFKEFTSIHQNVKVNSASVVDARSGSAVPSKKTIKVDDSMLDDIKKINAICFTYTIKVPTGVDENGVLLTSDCGLSASAYAHVKANISNQKEK